MLYSSVIGMGWPAYIYHYGRFVIVHANVPENNDSQPQAGALRATKLDVFAWIYRSIWLSTILLLVLISLCQ